MTDSTSSTPKPTISLDFAPDRSIAWTRGDSVRYLVARIRADGETPKADKTPAPVPLNLALCVDVSGSMAGEKLDAAKRTGIAVANALTAEDRLSIVTFSSRASVVLESRAMNPSGRAAAKAAIESLAIESNTNLFDGWALAGEQVALAMRTAARASHRILLISDGQANAGISDVATLAQHAEGLQQRGIITSAVGIGDGYDESLLGQMSAAGGGRLHDAAPHAAAAEFDEVVLGELREAREALLERAKLSVTAPRNARVEVVGLWSHTVRTDGLDILIGTLADGSEKHVVLRVFCPAGRAGTELAFSASVTAQLPDGSESIQSTTSALTITLANEDRNNAQERDLQRSLAALTAWSSATAREAVALNRAHDRRGAKHFLAREYRYLDRYARGIPGAEELLVELALLARKIEQDLGERGRKEVYAAMLKRERGEREYRSARGMSVREVLGRVGGHS